MKKRAFAILIIFLCSVSYANGVRLITLAEIPSSHRPWQLFLSADYAQAHLSETNYLDLMK